MLFLLIVVLGALLAAAHAARRAGRIAPWQYRVLVALVLAIALLAAAALAIDRIEAA